MENKLFVGNLCYNMTASDLEQLFANHGTVQSATIVADPTTDQSKGFGFVEMGNEQEALTAIAALHGRQIGGRTLMVTKAKPRQDRSRTGA